MSLSSYVQLTEAQRKRSTERRMLLVHGCLVLVALVIAARLIELQIIRGNDFHALAQSQHFGGVTLPAKRGEILSTNSKTGETSILATNTTLDMVYVDPVIVDDPPLIAEVLADVLVTEEAHSACRQGLQQCPRELTEFYGLAFDPLARVATIETGAILEPLGGSRSLPPVAEDELPDMTEVRRLFARDIEQRISEQRVRYVPLQYGANKIQMSEVRALNIRGVIVSSENRLIYADPEQVDQLRLSSIARQLSTPLQMEPLVLQRLLRSRPLRYVSVMHRLPPAISARIKELKLESQKDTLARRKAAPDRETAQKILDPLRSIALIPEHWRFYPDGLVASHVVGFLNASQEAQYGIERTFNPQLRGQEGLISAVSDLSGGQIVTGQQTIVDPKDGDTIVLTIDRFVQKEVEKIMENAINEFDADSGQAIVMEPDTGRIIAMVNAPLFDSNNYGNVYEKSPIVIEDRKRDTDLAIELYHPEDNRFVLKAYMDDVFTQSGRLALSTEKQEELAEIEKLYDIEDIARYYLYIGENSRREVFPTEREDVWLKFRNNVGVGAYLNRNIQEIYEPGSVLKAVTIAIAIDQGEISPNDTYQDDEPVEVDEYTIKNALNEYYGEVTMTNCLEFSINTCMTTVSTKLGKKLFHGMLSRFGFGRITGIDLEDELPGEILPWKKWSQALLATSAYGQGISSTPLQVVTAFSALANNGKLMRPIIVDTVIRSDGSVETNDPHVVDQVIKPETAETITAMLTSTVSNGFGKRAKVDGYRAAGKTGTSQIAGPGGKYETGTGAQITSFAGYAPVDDPQFVILVKIDRPRTEEYGSRTAAPVFREISAFLFRYYGIPPDEV